MGFRVLFSVFVSTKFSTIKDKKEKKKKKESDDSGFSVGDWISEGEMVMRGDQEGGPGGRGGGLVQGCVRQDGEKERG